MPGLHGTAARRVGLPAVQGLHPVPARPRERAETEQTGGRAVPDVRRGAGGRAGWRGAIEPVPQVPGQSSGVEAGAPRRYAESLFSSGPSVRWTPPSPPLRKPSVLSLSSSLRPTCRSVITPPSRPASSRPRVPVRQQKRAGLLVRSGRFCHSGRRRDFRRLVRPTAAVSPLGVREVPGRPRERVDVLFGLLVTLGASPGLGQRAELGARDLLLEPVGVHELAGRRSEPRASESGHRGTYGRGVCAGHGSPSGQWSER